MADYFDAPTDPADHSDGSSSTIRTIWTSLAAAFAKLAGYTGNGGKIVVINAGGTAQEAVSSLTVAQGGTGRATATTAYGLLAAGTTATGAHQTLAAGATTEILVGGGASALPVWTAATGSGAPVRATSPALTTPNIGTPSAGTLTNCTGLPIAGTTGYGTGVATALAVNVGSAGAPVVLNGAGGTPTSLTLTNATGLPAAGVTGTALVAAAIGTTVQAYDADLTTWAGVTPGTGVATALAVNVGGAGAPVVNGGVLGTPSSGTLTNCTGPWAILATPSFTTTIGVGSAAAAASGAGVTFPATQSASTDANTLDDYEEGTWTATLTGTTADPTTPITVSSPYTKIGRVVFCSAFFDSVNTTGATGNIKVTGMPFAGGASDVGVGALIMTGFGAAPAQLEFETTTTLGARDMVALSSISMVAAAGKYFRFSIVYNV